MLTCIVTHPEPGKHCVLVVEDDPSIRELYAIVLADGGYRVETAVDGQDGLDHLACAPDLILLDLLMPVMDGREFLCRLRGRIDDQRTPVLVLTANFAGSVLKGAQAVMHKPFENELLLGSVAMLIAAGV